MVTNQLRHYIYDAIDRGTKLRAQVISVAVMVMESMTWDGTRKGYSYTYIKGEFPVVQQDKFEPATTWGILGPTIHPNKKHDSIFIHNTVSEEV